MSLVIIAVILIVLISGALVALRVRAVDRARHARWIAEHDHRADTGRSTGPTVQDTVPAPRRSDRLPVGAEAALWSIVEFAPDPRNHLALTRDLTGEVRISGTVLDQVLPRIEQSSSHPDLRPMRPATAEDAPIDPLRMGESVRIIDPSSIDHGADGDRLSQAS